MEDDEYSFGGRYLLMCKSIWLINRYTVLPCQLAEANPAPMTLGNMRANGVRTLTARRLS